MLWRTPVLAGMRLPIVLEMPEGVRNVKEPTVQELTDSLVERRSVDAGPGGLAGRRIDFPGLQVTITDVLVRIEQLDGRTWTMVARPSAPFVEIAEARGTVSTALTFLTQGIEHILLGVDHLLFVFGLLLIVRTPWMLVKTITAFTVAHSITLAIATLGYAQVPAPPLNAAIALSILFLGARDRPRAGAGRRASRSAIRGWSRSPSDCCTASASRAGSRRSACRRATFRSRCSCSTSASRSASSRSSR